MTDITALDWLKAEEDLRLRQDPIGFAKLLRTDKPVPQRQRVFLAKVLKGEVALPSKKGRKGTLTTEQKEHIWRSLEGLRSWQGRAIREARLPESNVEVGEVIKENAAQKAMVLAWLAKLYDVKESTISKTHQREATYVAAADKLRPV